VGHVFEERDRGRGLSGPEQWCSPPAVLRAWPAHPGFVGSPISGSPLPAARRARMSGHRWAVDLVSSGGTSIDLLRAGGASRARCQASRRNCLNASQAVSGSGRRAAHDRPVGREDARSGAEVQPLRDEEPTVRSRWNARNATTGCRTQSGSGWRDR
jgi:hypothetical protein